MPVVQHGASQSRNNLRPLKSFDAIRMISSMALSSILFLSVSSATAATEKYLKPTPPPSGGVYKVPHPHAQKGLIRIEEDGTYIYNTHRAEKSQAVSIKVGAATPPQIKGNDSAVDFATMYGSSSLVALNVDYEWQALQGLGALGLQVGGGLNIVTGDGFLPGGVRSFEKYTLYMVPLSAFVIYRLEFSRKQWFVPYLLGGGTVVGLVEARDDGKTQGTAIAPAAGGAVGAHLSLTFLDPAAAYSLSEDFGIADLWFTVEGRVLQGLRSDINYTTQMLTAGITLDF